MSRWEREIHRDGSRCIRDANALLPQEGAIRTGTGSLHSTGELTLHRRYGCTAVFDGNAPSSKLALAELQQERVRTSLKKYAVWRTGSEVDAEDLLADGIECVCDPDRKPWDPAKGSFFRHMRLVMDGIAIEQARGGHRRFEVPDVGITFDQGTVDPKPLADEALHAERDLAWLRHLGTVLMGRLREKDPIARKVFEVACEGVEEPQEQARRIGCPVEGVYEALRRLRYHGAKVRAEEDQAEAERMKRAREEARKGGRS
jgi:DNA-directed RNA polymerase specialized sigma24 family protein